MGTRAQRLGVVGTAVLGVAALSWSVTSASIPPADDGANVYPVQPDGVPFPAEDWPEADLPAGIDQGVLDDAVAVAFGAPDAEQRIASIVIVQGGQIVFERYHPLDSADEIFPSWSMAKSFTSALIGLLVADGRLSLDEHPERPEWADPGDPRQEITLRDLLQMSSGLQWDEGPDYIPWASSPDASAFVAERPLESDPGTTFEYSTGTTSLLAGIAADELGGCEQMESYLNERLLDPIGIASDTLVRDARGCWFGGFGMNMTTRDFARFGLLYLRGGLWDGVQILPTSWVDETRVPATTNPSYGLQFWIDSDDGYFEANGAMGQRIVIVPALDLVVAVNSFQGDHCRLVGGVLTEFAGELMSGCPTD